MAGVWYFCFASFNKSIRFGGGGGVECCLLEVAIGNTEAWNSHCPATAPRFQTFLFVPARILLVSKLWIMAVMCSILAWIWYEKRDFCLKARSLEAWALCFAFRVFFIIFLLFFVWREKRDPLLAVLTIQCRGFFAPRRAQGLYIFPYGNTIWPKKVKTSL